MINLETKKSDIAGEGVFAKEDIASGESIGLGFERVRDTGNPDTDYRRTSLGEKINHSGTPNVRLFEDGGKFYVVSLRDIKSGEELALDYRSFPWEGKRDFA